MSFSRKGVRGNEFGNIHCLLWFKVEKDDGFTHHVYKRLLTGSTGNRCFAEMCMRNSGTRFRVLIGVELFVSRS